MPTRQASAQWEGTLKEGKGQIHLPSITQDLPYTRGSRFDEDPGSNPEELIAAAHAGCFTMFLSGLLSKDGLEPARLETTADVTIESTDDGPTITRIELHVEGEVPGIDEDGFRAKADEANATCPVSKALASVNEITVDARLVS